jgi:hypothetical protein
MRPELAPKTFCCWLLTHLPNQSNPFVYLQPLTFYVGTPVQCVHTDEVALFTAQQNQTDDSTTMSLLHAIRILLQICYPALTHMQPTSDMNTNQLQQ